MINKTWLYLLISFCLILLGLGFFLWANKPAMMGLDPDTIKNYAQELQNNQLYKLAVVEYCKLADNPGFSEQKRANINFIIGKIYLENLFDYENALARFLKARQDDKGNKLGQELNRLTVECLEKMGRRSDAQQKLAESTALKQETKKETGGLAAKIGQREIHISELDEQIAALPPYIQESLKTPAQKLDFLKKYVANELLSEAAIRKGLDKNSQLKAQVESFRKQLLSQKLYEEEVGAKVTFTPEEIKAYYEAHQEEYAKKEGIKEKPKFEKIASEVGLDLKKQKEQEMYGKFMNELQNAQKVVVYDDLFR